MNEVIERFLGFVRGAWRYRWRAQMIAWPLCFAGWLVVYLLPNQYQSSARVFVDTQSMLRPLLQGLAVQTNVNEQAQAMMRTLLNRPNLEKVARMTDMDLEAKTPEDMEMLLNRLSKKIVLTNASGQQNIFSISYVNSDPELAKKVVQSMLTLFVESSLGDSRKDNSSAQRFLDEQIQDYDKKLLDAEERLKDFKRQNVSVMPSEGRGYYDRLQTETAVLERSKLDLREAEFRRDELQKQILGEEPTFGMVQQRKTITAATATSSLDLRIQAFETRLDDMLLKYTNEHPDVIALQHTIDDLKAQSTKNAPPPPPEQAAVRPALETNPVYQQLKVALGEAEADVAGLRVRVTEYQARVDRLDKLVDTVPQVEADLARLNRDYQINKQNYETLITRRESAKISQDAEQSSDNLKFKIVDPPRLPVSPIAPNRPLLATVVLLGGIAAGLGFALFLSQIKPTYDTQRAIKDDTRVPVLGYVSMVWTDKARLRYRVEVISYGIITAGLFASFGLYMAFQVFRSHGSP